MLDLSGKKLGSVLSGWFFVVFDGYDLIVYRTVQTALAHEWGLTQSALGSIGSMAFIGMVVGAVLIGRISDRVGRKAAVIGSVTTLSVFTMLCAFAPSPWMFATMRLLAGIGLGGLLPSVNAMIADLVSARYVSAWATLMMSGVPLGGSTAAIIARWVVPFDPDWGWRCMFLIALAGIIIGLPVAIAVIPADSKKSRETQREARFFDLLNPTYRAVTIWFLIATFGTLLAWYGLGTWLPRLMHTAGYDFGAVLLFTLALNLGAVLGSILTACAGVCYGPVKAGSFAARLAGVSLLMLLTSPSTSAVYVILVLAGIGRRGTQILVIAAVADFYPSALQGTALGWALGFG